MTLSVANEEQQPSRVKGPKPEDYRRTRAKYKSWAEHRRFVYVREVGVSANWVAHTSKTAPLGV